MIRRCETRGRGGGRGRRRRSDVGRVGLDNEGETVVAWDARDAASRSPRRSCGRAGAASGSSSGSRAEGVEERVRELAGTPLEPYFSSTKITWLLENDPAVQAAARRHGPGSARSTPTSWPASATARAPSRPPPPARSCRRIAAPGRWDPELCRIFGVDPDALPPIGAIDRRAGDDRGLPLRAMLVDQTAALAGHGCFGRRTPRPPTAPACSCSQNAGTTPPRDPPALLPTVAWTSPTAPPPTPSTAACSRPARPIDWLRDAPRPDRERRRDRGAGALGARHRRRSLPAGADRPRRAAGGGPTRAPFGRDDRAHHPRAPGARGARIALTLRVRDIVEALAATARPSRAAARRRGHDRERWLMQRQADVLGIPVVVSHRPRRPRWARRRLQASARGCSRSATWRVRRVVAAWSSRSPMPRTTTGAGTSSRNARPS